MNELESPAPAGRGRLLFCIPFLVGLIFLVLVYLTAGKVRLEKTLTDLATPVGLSWCLFLFTAYWSVLKRQTLLAVLTGLAFLLLTVGGNLWFSDQLIRNLEASYYEIDPFTEPAYDMIIVLGGGTKMSRPNYPELNCSGERVALAAELYFAGQTKKILCTGSQSLPKKDWDWDPSREAKEILLRLKVPAAAIEVIPGRNTYEEAQSLKELFAGQAGTPRVGLLTSAFHLNRAMRLTNAVGLELHPIPAGFVSGPMQVDLGHFVPSSGSLMQSSIFCREALAGFAAR